MRDRKPWRRKRRPYRPHYNAAHRAKRRALAPWSRPEPLTAPGVVCRSDKTSTGTWGTEMTVSATQGRSTGSRAIAPRVGTAAPLATPRSGSW